jgi:ribosomal protein S27E
MSQPTRPRGAAEPAAGPAGTLPVTDRVHISCPGCGRHDWVSWAQEQPTYEWKCFNCGKTFTLERKGGH